MNSLILVMGVSGSGKTTVGKHLAQHLGFEFVDGDDLHSVENVEQMRAGMQLDDEARKPWMDAICRCAQSHFDLNQSVVIACSALKSRYRQALRTVSPTVLFVFLKGKQDVIKPRMEQRRSHYMPPSLLESQLADLEDPTGEANVVVIDVDQPVASMLDEAVEKTLEQLKRIYG